MSVEYKAVQWNRQKRIYDFVLVGGVALYLLAFGALTECRFPNVTEEILLMRAFGTAAFLLLHIILCIGPLCRLNPKFLPLLYNRRHAGVTMFLLALIHAVLVIATYHAGGDTNPLLSIFVSSPLTGSVAGVPFQPFGFFALVILFLMAATSHDFWLANLSAPVWKSLHMMVYVAYALLVLHVTFGALQGETSPVYVAAMAAGFVTVLALHITAARKEIPVDHELKNEVRRRFRGCLRHGRHSRKPGAHRVSCRANAWRFSNTTEKFPPSPTCASTRTVRSVKAKSFLAASPVRGTVISTCRKRVRRRRHSWKKFRRSTCV